MTSLIEALKKLAAGGAADSAGLAAPGLVDAERVLINLPSSRSAAQCVDGELGTDAAEIIEQGLELYHRSLVSLPTDAPPVERNSAAEEVSVDIDQSPVDLVESPLMGRTLAQSAASGRAYPTTGESWEHGQKTACDPQGDRTAPGVSTPVQDHTVVAAEIPELWQVLSQNSFDIDDAPDLDPYPQADQQDEAAWGTSPPSAVADIVPAGPPPIKQPAEHDSNRDNSILDIVRQCSLQESTDGSALQDANATRGPVPSPRPASGESTATLSRQAEAPANLAVANAVAPPSVPRRIAAKRRAPTAFEKSLQAMICDHRQGRQLGSLHRRVQQIVAHARSCGIVSVQRDPHVAQLIGCLGMMYAGSGNQDVLLVDANAELCQLTDGFELRHLPGLSDMCTGACRLNAAAHRTSINGVSVMPMGTTLELMATWSGVASAIAEATREFGLVLVDAGHAYGDSTASVAAACHRLLIHVHLGKTQREMARNVADMFFSNNLTVSGVVVTNAVDVR